MHDIIMNHIVNQDKLLNLVNIIMLLPRFGSVPCYPFKPMWTFCFPCVVPGDEYDILFDHSVFDDVFVKLDNLFLDYILHKIQAYKLRPWITGFILWLFKWSLNCAIISTSILVKLFEHIGYINELAAEEM